MRRIVNESFFVSYDVSMLNGSENTDLVQCVLLLFVRELLHSNFLKCIELVVCYSPHMIDA